MNRDGHVCILAQPRHHGQFWSQHFALQKSTQASPQHELTRPAMAMAAAATSKAQRQSTTTCARARACQGWSAISMRSGCMGEGEG